MSPPPSCSSPGSPLLAAPGAGAVSGADRAATRAYLQAEYAYERTVQANASASARALEATAHRIGGECPGVLAGAPKRYEGLLAGVEHEPKLSRRQEGERARGQDELQAVLSEIDATLQGASDSPNRVAAARLDAAVAPLRWSNPQLARDVAFQIALQESAEPHVEDVCGDLRAWAASGYRTLAPSTRAVRARQAETFSKVLARGLGQEVPFETLLRRYEGPDERALSRKLDSLQLHEFAAGLSILQIHETLYRALGLHEEEGEKEPEHGHETVLGKGHARAGGSFTVGVEQVPPAASAPCRFAVNVNYTPPQQPGTFVFQAGGSFRCVSSRATREHPTTVCGDGVIEIEALLPAAARRVRLDMNDGSTLTSRTIAIPPRLGGPAAFYFQAVRGPRPYPVSLTELDRHGSVLGVRALQRITNCKVEQPHIARRTLVSGSTPDGEGFSISGIAFDFGHHAQFALGLIDSRSLLISTNDERAHGGPRLFRWKLSHRCPPHEHAILYGVLKHPAASVLARTATGEVALREVPIPARLHAGGRARLRRPRPRCRRNSIYRDTHGHTLRRESLARQARAEAEFCEGYGEPFAA